jgi:hypothetical protein
MNETNPKTMWHADGEGRCHAGCEQYDQKRASACKLLGLLPWGGLMSRCVTEGIDCPFAVLADALCLHERRTDEEHRCGTCVEWQFTDKTDDGVRPCAKRCGSFSCDGPPWDCRFWRKR